ncbi:MAG TPA: hypothetical protein VFU36_06895, partial [Jatrophihabitans sp.]|nr:hypothetical protein [Jatrophihabitans sp.]
NAYDYADANPLTKTDSDGRKVVNLLPPLKVPNSAPHHVSWMDKPLGQTVYDPWKVSLKRGPQYGRQPQYFEKHMYEATLKGVPYRDVKLLTELIGLESSWKYWESNYKWPDPKFTQWGYGMVDEWDRNRYIREYAREHPGAPKLDYRNPVDQIVITWMYCQGKYHGVVPALIHWEYKEQTTKNHIGSY